MDKDKAIELLKKVVRCTKAEDTRCHGSCDVCDLNVTDEEYIEATEIAIKALEGKDTNVPTNDGKTLVVKIPKEYLDTTARVILDCDPWCKLFYEDAAPTWIPFTADTMPKEDGEYFVLYDDKYAEDYDTGSVGVADFYKDCEAFGYYESRYDPVLLGYVDSEFFEIKVKKWMPIPKEE